VNERISPILLDQRIRNRIIECLEIASSYDEQLKYEANVPIAHVPNEIINMWEDSVDRSRLDEFAEPVYSPNEQAAIRRFHAVWEGATKDTPDRMPPLSKLIGTEPWERLRVAAQQALAEFRLRGKFNEDREEFSN
jgi:hypothetical protein